MEAILSEHGVPDVLINNAGFAVYRAFEQSDAGEIERLFEVNFAGHIRCTKAVLDGMIAKREGQIVNIVSVAGLFTLTPNAVYGATKSGIVTWSRALRVELDRYGSASQWCARVGWRHRSSTTRPSGGERSGARPH